MQSREIIVAFVVWQDNQFDRQGRGIKSKVRNVHSVISWGQFALYMHLFEELKQYLCCR